MWAVTVDVQHSEVQLHPTSPGDWSDSHNILVSRSGLGIGNLPEDAVLVSRSIAVPIASAAPFLAVTAVWTIEGAQPAEAAIDVRVSQDDTTWGEWEPVPVNSDLSTDSPAFFGGLLYFPKETRQVQFRVTLPRGVGAISTLTSLRAIFISPGETPASPAEQSIGGSPSAEAVSKPSVVTRVGWGCPDGESSPEWPPQYTTVNFLIVHHTDDTNNHTDWAAVVRSIFTLHKVTRGWGDIGYNYLVDPNGIVYEGRAGGDNVIGAHFSCANSNTMGVAFLGTFSSVQPTQSAITSVTSLLAWKAAQRGIDPFASAYHPSTQLTIHTISGHRDANGTPSPTACDKGTVCPGDVLYSMLPTLRSAVSSLINPTSTPTIQVVSPNGGESWSANSPHSVTWTSSGLNSSGKLYLILSLDGGNTEYPTPIAILNPGVASYSWTPTSAQVTTAARIGIGNLMGGNYEAIDWSDQNFKITSSQTGTVPTVTANAATNVTSSSATLNATITNDGGSAIIDRRFEWGIAPSWSNATNLNGGTIVVSGNNFSYTLTGLQANTTYQFRGWAKNGVDWNMSAPLTFTTGSVATTCTFSLASTAASPSGDAGSSSISVTGSPSGCTGSWSASASSTGSWLTLTGNTSGSGSGTTQVGYSYTKNPSTTSTRAGTVTFTGQFSTSKTFTVTQSASTAPACSYSLDKTTATGAGSGGSGSVQVTGSPSGCTGSWSAAASSSGNWLSLTGTASSSGAGSWPVSYSFGTNPSTSSTRTGTINFSGSFSATFTLTQSPSTAGGCVYSIDKTSATGAVSGGSGSVQVTGSPSGCSGSWSAAASSSGNWLSLTSTTSGNGAGVWQVGYSFGSNPNTAARVGTITFSGSLSATFTLTQSAASGGGGGSGELIADGGFESATATGNAAPGWAVYPSPGSGHLLIVKNGAFPHNGSNYAVLGGSDNTAFDELQQTVSIPDAATAANLTLWVKVATQEPSTDYPYDFLSVVLYDASGNFITTLRQVTNQDASSGYFKLGPFDLSAYKGTSIQLVLLADNDSIYPTTFYVDDVSVQTTAPVQETLPAAPSGMTAVALSPTSIQISWTDNSSNETGFIIYRWNGAAWAPIATAGAGATTYTDSGLQPGTTYSHLVCAQNAAGSNCPGSSSSATTFPAAPSAPTGMSATALSSTSIKVSWTDNATNETGFLIYRWNGAAWAQIATVGANVTSYTDSGLQPSTTYQHIACAQNSGGTMCPGTSSSATTFPSAPAPPTGMTAAPLSSTSIKISWIDNSTTETGFIVYRWTGAGWGQVATVGANVTSYTDSGLQPSTSYSYIACAQNAGGTMCPASAGSATTAPAAPAAPTGLSAVALSSTSIKVSWIDNSTTETGFLVYRWTGSAWGQIATVGANVTSYTDSGLQPSTAYSYIACAQNGGGTMCPGLAGTATTTPAAPAAPTGMSATALSSSSIKVTWTDNATNETGFVVYRWTGAWSQIATVGANITSYTDSGLQPSTTYSYVACAQNAGGAMCPAAAGSATTSAAVQSMPAAPNGMSAVALSSSSIRVSWLDNATNETAFVIYRWNGVTWVQIATVGANVTSYIDTGLQSSTTYFHVACAQNGAGMMCPGTASSATTQASTDILPAPPSGMSAAALSSSSIRVSWTDNSNNETGFIIYRWNGATWVQVGTAGPNVTTYTDTGLQPVSTYFHIACAQNGAGTMCPALYSSATTTP
jgi:hypothetical protein